MAEHVEGQVDGPFGSGGYFRRKLVVHTFSAIACAVPYWTSIWREAKAERLEKLATSRGSPCLYIRFGQTVKGEPAYSHLCKDPSRPLGTTVVSFRRFSLFIALHRLTETLDTRS
jgi:hypothetical protein